MRLPPDHRITNPEPPVLGARVNPDLSLTLTPATQAQAVLTFTYGNTGAAIAGIKKLPEGQVEGRSLLPLLNEDQKTLPDNRFLFTHKARWATGTDPNTHQWKNFAVRSQRYRFVGGGTAVSVSERQRKHGVSPKDALFDMLKDPGQRTNIIDQHPEVAEKMRAAYNKFWKEARPLMVNESAPMSKTRPFHVWYAEQMKNSGIPQWKAPKL